jgi:hypothetical protein
MTLWPNTDLAALRGWLDKRAASLKRERLPHEGIWRELAEHFEPDLARALDDGDDDPEAAAATLRDRKIMTSTPRTELHRMAAALKSGTANESRQWFRLKRGGSGDDTQAENPAHKQWFDKATRGMSWMLNNSNAYGALGQMFLHTGLFSCSAGLVTGEHPQDILEILVIDEGAWWAASTRRGRIDVLLRRVSMTARELVEEFGETRAPDRALEALENGRDEERTRVWNLVCPADRERFPDLDASRAFASVYWTDEGGTCGGGADTSGIVDIRSYAYNPILCPRWDVVNGVYGIGPGRIGLPEARELYRLESDSLKGVAQRVDPPMAAPDGMAGAAINTFPGGITYYPESMGRDRSVHPLFDTLPDVSGVENKIQQVEARLRRVFYADLFNAILNTANFTGVQMTARQVEEMSGEKISLLGPVLTNMNHGLFDPLVEACFWIMAEKGLLPETPPGMEGGEWQAEYVSTLHMRQQEEARLGGVVRFMSIAQGVLTVRPAAADKIDFEQLLDEAAEALGVPGSVIRSDKDVEKLRARAARDLERERQAAALAEAGRQAPGYADAAKKLSETPAGDGTALEALAGAAGRTGGGLL